jgi:hypothetical protein
MMTSGLIIAIYDYLGDDAVLVGAIATAMDSAWDLVFDRRVRRSASEA